MNFCSIVLVFILTLSNGNGEGIFSKIMNHGRSESAQANNFGKSRSNFNIYEPLKINKMLTLVSNLENEAAGGVMILADVCETVRVMPRIAMAVVGGSPVRLENSAPYIAAVGERTSNGSVSWFCGGSLISPYDILTAAHCLVSRNVSTIRVGSFSTKKRSTENDYEVSNIIIHPGYKITESYNDIGIIKVKRAVTFDSNIKPICLPQNNRDKYEKERPKVIGWGAEEFGGEGSQKLQQVEVEVFSNSNCEKAYRNSTIAPKTFPRGITNEQLCAGSKKGGKDACQGDSGGPLVLTDEHGIVRQIGIVSTGAGCGFKMYPGVYTRVSSYADWIEQTKNSGSGESHQKNSHDKNSFPSKPSAESRPKSTQTSSQSSGNSRDKTHNTHNQTLRETNFLHNNNNNNNNNSGTKVIPSDSISLPNSVTGKKKTTHDSQEFFARGKGNRENERTVNQTFIQNQHYRTRRFVNYRHKFSK